MDDIPLSQTLIPPSSPPPSYPNVQPASYATPTMSLSPTPPQTPQQPILRGITRRPKKQPNPNPQQISEKLAALDDEIVDAFSTLVELVDIGIKLVSNKTEQRFFYGRMQELRDDFDTLVIIRGGRKTRKTVRKNKSKLK